MSRSSPLRFTPIALVIVVLLLAAGSVGVFAGAAGAAPSGDGAAQVMRAVATPSAATDPGTPPGRPIDRQVWLEHLPAALIFSVIIWGVVGSMVVALVVSGRLTGTPRPGRPSGEATARR